MSVTFDAIESEYQKLYEKDLVKIDKIVDDVLWRSIIDAEDRLNSILGKVIVGHGSVDVSGLIQKLNMSSWVAAGRTFLDKSDGVCPFCQQPLVDRDGLINKLNEFFDESYNKSLQELEESSRGYMEKIGNLKNRLNELRRYEVISSACDKILASIADPVSLTISAISDKKEKPNVCYSISSIEGIKEQIVSINQAIKSNNSDVDQLSTLKSRWVEMCWYWMASKMSVDVRQYNLRADYYHNRLLKVFTLHEEMVNSRMLYCRNQIERLRQTTVNTKEAVDNINTILHNVGFVDFSIEEVPSHTASTQYRLKRLSDTGATDVYKSLSEGEKTFISFLYFYQLCIGTDDMTQSAKKKVIVIDDPISSLDSQTLFIVSSIVRKMIMHSDSNKNQFKDKNINQIFILTHNLYFYKEISFERRPSCRDVMHYNLRKVAGHTIIDSSSKQLATDDYSLMWESLKVVKGQTGVDETRNMMVCNTMRRIIDTFVGFIGLSKGSGNPTWASISALSSTDPRYIVASSFIAQINDDSHGVHVFDNAYYGNIIRQDTSVLFDAFKLVFDEIGTDHYAMMMC